MIAFSTGFNLIVYCSKLLVEELGKVTYFSAYFGMHILEKYNTAGVI